MTPSKRLIARLLVTMCLITVSGISSFAASTDIKIHLYNDLVEQSASLDGTHVNWNAFPVDLNSPNLAIPYNKPGVPTEVTFNSFAKDHIRMRTDNTKTDYVTFKVPQDVALKDAQSLYLLINSYNTFIIAYGPQGGAEYRTIGQIELILDDGTVVNSTALPGAQLVVGINVSDIWQGTEGYYRVFYDPVSSIVWHLNPYKLNMLKIDLTSLASINRKLSKISVKAEKVFQLMTPLGQYPPVSAYGGLRLMGITLVASTQEPLSITTPSLPNGKFDIAYNQGLAVTGGVRPYKWALSSGALPEGLSLSESGIISGTPTSGGTASFTVKVTDSAATPATDTKAFTISIDDNPSVKIGLYRHETTELPYFPLAEADKASAIVADGTVNTTLVAMIKGISNPNDYKVLFELLNADLNCGAGLHSTDDTMSKEVSVHWAMVDDHYEARIDYNTPRWWFDSLNDDEIKVTLKHSTNGVVASDVRNLNLRPCPIFLIHGIWAKAADWDGVTGLKQFLKNYYPIPTQWIRSIDYSSTHASKFAVNTAKLSAYTINYIYNLRLEGVAINKVDAIAHSMGGILVRKASEDPSWDYIHKLITIDTPHRGSSSADFTVNLRQHPICGNIFKIAMQCAGRPITDGAVDDLLTTSPNLPYQTTKIWSHAVVGKPFHEGPVKVADALAAGTDMWLSVVMLPAICPPAYGIGPLYFPEDNDLVVEESSQIGNIITTSVSSFSSGPAYSHGNITKSPEVHFTIKSLLETDPLHTSNSFSYFK